MGYWNTRGLRGSVLEELINNTNEMYLKHNLAVIQKVPTPITPIKIDSKSRKITEAFFGEKSTVDYIGTVQGIPVCFDAKQTSQKSLPIQNIHEHQVEFMRKFVEQKGVAFLLVQFAEIDESYFLPFDVLNEYYLNSKDGGRKSIPYSAFEDKYRIYNKKGYMVHYLEALNTYIMEKEDN